MNPVGYHNQPISGFTGHMPGAKWQVGGKYLPPQAETHSVIDRGAEGRFRSPPVDDIREDSNFADMTNDELRASLDQMQMGMQKLQRVLAGNNMQPNGYLPSATNSELSMGFNSQGMPTRRDGPVSDTAIQVSNRQGRETDRQQSPQTAKQRSRSMPRRIEKDPFEGIESGWWSKGEIQRNKERREIANRGQAVAGGNWSQRPPSPQRVTRRFVEGNADEDIPTAGYSGHIQGMRALGIGKPFNVAAKQAKKEYIERRRAYSGSRDNIYGQQNRPRYNGEEIQRYQ